MSAAWPPPPDMESIQELVANADVEGFIAEGSPSDEYESEGEALHSAIQHFPSAEITHDNLVPILDLIWQKSFSLDAAALAERGPALRTLAAQIERFFGPESKPQVRGS